MDFKDYLQQAAHELDREVGQILKAELQRVKKIISRFFQPNNNLIFARVVVIMPVHVRSKN